jgi:hypothetical protein
MSMEINNIMRLHLVRSPYVNYQKAKTKYDSIKVLPTEKQDKSHHSRDPTKRTIDILV